METLALQTRLSHLSSELRRIEQDPQVFARAHHYFAVRGAYDALLLKACIMLGLNAGRDLYLPVGEGIGEEERFRAELELSSRGWSW